MRNISLVQPGFAATGPITAHCDSCSDCHSSTMRTARSPNSGEYLLEEPSALSISSHRLSEHPGAVQPATYVIMDNAYEGDETRQTVRDLGMTPVVPPKSNRLEPWEYDREQCKQRNEVERLFGRLKRFRRVFTRFGKLGSL